MEPDPFLDDDKRDDPTVGRLASKALSVLAARRSGVGMGIEGHVTALIEAVRSDDPSVRRDVVAALQSDGVCAERICDTVIPEAARRMGDAWCNDEMSFAAVSMGTARLQSLLRELMPGRDALGGDNTRQVVVMVLSDAYHTLGAMVLTGQLRRMGVSVKLMIGHPVADVVAAIDRHQIDGVLISSPANPHWDGLLQSVDALHAGRDAPVTVVLGGGIVSHGAAEVTRRTGADAVTSDPSEALAAIERVLARRSAP